MEQQHNASRGGGMVTLVMANVEIVWIYIEWSGDIGDSGGFGKWRKCYDAVLKLWKRQRKRNGDYGSGSSGIFVAHKSLQLQLQKIQTALM